MKKMSYYFFRATVILFSLVPFWLLYKLSDFVAFILRRVVGYRLKVVRMNLKNSFPEKSETELRRIERASYLNLSDIMLETIKGFSMSGAEIKRRFVFTTPNAFDALMENKVSCIMVAAHYANWEWGALSFPQYVSIPLLGFYKPLSNPYTDRYAHKNRSSLGVIMVSIKDTAGVFQKYKNTQSAFVLLSDQSPSTHRTHWLRFLNQDTACLKGADKYGHLTNLPVYYVDQDRVARGHYVFGAELLCENPAQLPEGEVTRLFMQRLEQKLIKNPDNWLWSHKRWKLKLPENTAIENQ